MTPARIAALALATLTISATAACAALPTGPRALAIEPLAATHANGSEYRFPVVAGGSPAAARINDHLQTRELEKRVDGPAETAFDRIWPAGDSWHGTTEMDYAIEANGPGFLSLVIYRSTMGAYPSSFARSYAFDARTGDPLTLTALFTPAGLARLHQRVTQQRLAWLDDFVAGESVDRGPGREPIRLREDPGEAEEQKALYRECRPRVARDDLASNDLAFRPLDLTLGREECAPHALRALDELGFFRISLPYPALREDLNDYGRCLLVSRRADCSRAHAVPR